MSNNSPTQKCQKCGQPRVRQGKFCVICGTRFTDSEPSPEIVEEAEENVVETVSDDSTHDRKIGRLAKQAETTPPEKKSLINLDKGIEFLSYLRKNLAVVLISVGAISIIGAVAFTVIMLLPEEIISGVDVPPIEGRIFDLFVIIGLIAILIKEGVVVSGYIRKKGPLDRWFSFVLLLVFWINLITWSLGFIQESIFIDFGVSFALTFMLLSIHCIIPSLVYFRRFNETLFSGIFSINIVSMFYLLQWIIPIDPLLYSLVVYILVIIVILIAFLWKDIVPFIGLNILLPVIFISPYILSNSVVILVLILLNLFPFIEILLRNYLDQKSEFSNLIQTIGYLISPLGMITTCFVVYYGYIDVIIALALFTMPVLGFMVLNFVKPIFKRNEASNIVILSFLLFSSLFLDLSTEISPVLYGVNLLLVIQIIVVVFFSDQGHKEKPVSNQTIFLMISLIVISLTKIDFFWKIVFVLLPLSFLCLFLLRKGPQNHVNEQIIIFGVELIFLISFIRTPPTDWVMIYLLLVLALLGLSALILLNRNRIVEGYSRDLIIFVIIFELLLLVIMLSTHSSVEMLHPMLILIAFAVLFLLVEGQRRISSEFRWINASFLICFGLMTFWNEFDEIMVIFVTLLLILPLVIDLFRSKDTDKSSLCLTPSKDFNLNISLSGIGLSLIIFFEEFSPINHGIIYLIAVITWLSMYFSSRKSLGDLSILTIIIFPGIIFFFELLMHDTIFTPITEINYFSITFLVILLPIVLLQIDKSFFMKDTITSVVNPFVIGSVVITLLSIVAFLVYEFTAPESEVLIFGISVGIIGSAFFIEWQYESGLQLVISSIPPLFFLEYLETYSLMFYLLPLMPILVNFFIGIRYFKTRLNIQLQEIILVTYLIIFVLFNPIQILVYSTALISLFLVSWQILGIIKRKQDKATFLLASTINSGLVLGLTFLLDPLPQDLFVLDITISLILILVCLVFIFTTVSTVLHLLYWQFKETDANLSILMTLILIFDSSAVIFALIALLTRYTELQLGDILFTLLISTIVLGILLILVYTRGIIVKSEISAGGLYVTTFWLILSSTHSPTIEAVFLWLFFAPILMIVYLTKKDRSIGLIGMIFYLIAGIQLLSHTLDFMLLGDSEWLTILGLIVYGIEMVTLGIYASLTRKSNQELAVTETVQDS